MTPDPKALARLVVAPGADAGLDRRDPADRLGLESHEATQAEVAAHTKALAELQNRLWAENERALLVILQGVDASGKDGAISHVFAGLNPRGVSVTSFKAPTGAELAHDYLWRVHAACPARGSIGIFNRSHYEDLVSVRARGTVSHETVRRRYRHVREFERTLVEEGTTVLKLFLHVSQDEQRARLEERLHDPAKQWKFQLGDLDDRRRWGAFAAAYEEALTETSTESAPWHVVPADHKWVRNAAASAILVSTLRAIDPQIPERDDLSGVTID